MRAPVVVVSSLAALRHPSSRAMPARTGRFQAMMRSEPMHDDNLRSRAAPTAREAPPIPDAAFRWDHETWGHALRCVPLEPAAKHLFTSRQLGLPANGSDRDTSRAWALVTRSMKVRPEDLLRVRQVHGNVVRVVRRGDVGVTTTSERPDGDAIVSDAPGLALAVVVADCVPILLADREGRAVAAIHAGWRGTCAGIATAAVEAMSRAFGTRPADLVAAIGPSIGPGDYVVGESLVDAFIAAGHDHASVKRWFRRAPAADALLLDLWGANRDQLERAGVRPESIHSSGLSTLAHPGWFESFRRDAGQAGRMIAVVRVGGEAEPPS
jgi:polyphenol oxidase